MTHPKPPKIDNTPGIVWRPLKDGWVARWQARTDLVARGYPVKSVRIWAGAWPSEMDEMHISDDCVRLQDEMLVWSQGGYAKDSSFTGSVRSLIVAYQTDADSTYRKARYASRKYYDALCLRLEKDCGEVEIGDIKARMLVRWHENWTEASGVSMAHALVGMLRTIINFGATLLEDEQCERVSGHLQKMRFKMGKARTEQMTVEQANDIRSMAHKLGLHSIALAQAFQFECMLRQKDVIGEWVPISEPGPPSEVISGNSKWIRGLRWSEIDADVILRHTTSKRLKDIQVNLSLAPMVLEELDRLGPRPASGPIIVDERTRLPFTSSEFRRKWREIANLCDIPKNVRNMDSRAGAISEATDAGADLEHVRQAATHGDIAMTQRYSRNANEKIENVQRLRVAHRGKK